MNALSLLAEVERYAGTITLDGDNLKIRGPVPLPPDLMAKLREAKADILAVLRDGTATTEPCACLVCRPDLWEDGFSEVVSTWPRKNRAGFREGVRVRENAGLTTEEAQRAAYLDELGRLKR